jgi:hypothetical protein
MASVPRWMTSCSLPARRWPWSGSCCGRSRRERRGGGAGKQTTRADAPAASQVGAVTLFLGTQGGFGPEGPRPGAPPMSSASCCGGSRASTSSSPSGRPSVPLSTTSSSSPPRRWRSSGSCSGRSPSRSTESGAERRTHIEASWVASRPASQTKCLRVTASHTRSQSVPTTQRLFQTGTSSWGSIRRRSRL